MPGFRFRETDSFEAKWGAFLAEMGGIDADMASVLRSNKHKLAEIVRQGNLDAQIRAEFNAGVMAALDKLLVSGSEKEQR